MPSFRIYRDNSDERPESERNREVASYHSTSNRLTACPRGCPENECYCAEPTVAEQMGMCTGCGGIDECYCNEP